MLRQWVNRAAVLVLGAEGIVLRRSGTHDIHLISHSIDSYTCEQLLDALHKQAGELGLRRVRFILANQFVRYAVLPWQPGVYAMQDWLALAAHQFQMQFGAMAESWELRVALQGYGKPAVACALDEYLSTRLLALADEVGWTVQGIEPALMTVFNRHHTHFAKQDHWLFLAEPQRLLLGQIENGAWQHFYIDSPFTGEESAAGQRMIERALRLQGGTRPSAVACFGPSALLPDSLADDMSLIRLPYPVAAPHTNSLDMLATIA